MIVTRFLFFLVFITGIFPLLSEESKCGKRPPTYEETKDQNFTTEESDKGWKAWFEWSHCDEYEKQESEVREKVRLGKKRRIKIKEFDFVLKNIPKEMKVYRKREKYLNFSCLKRSLYFKVNQQPLVKIEDGQKRTVELGPKNGIYFRDVYWWHGSSYKTKDFICNASCSALVDFEYKDWFLKNVYFRVE